MAACVSFVCCLVRGGYTSFYKGGNMSSSVMVCIDCSEGGQNIITFHKSLSSQPTEKCQLKLTIFENTYLLTCTRECYQTFTTF